MPDTAPPLTVQIRWSMRTGLPDGFEAVLLRSSRARREPVIIDAIEAQSPIDLPDDARARWGDLPVTYADGTEALIAELRADEARA